jgi:hypothetical protein
MVVECKQRAQGSSSVNPSSNPVWQLIWKLRVPRAVHLFLWQAFNDIHPTKEKLYKQKVVPDPICPTCGVVAESVCHSLWWCRATSTVWNECGVRIHISALKDGDFLSIFEQLSNRLDREDLELLALIAQKIWYRRNNIVFGGALLPPRCLANSAKETMEEFSKAQAPSQFPSRSSHHHSSGRHPQWSQRQWIGKPKEWGWGWGPSGPRSQLTGAGYKMPSSTICDRPICCGSDCGQARGGILQRNGFSEHCHGR